MKPRWELRVKPSMNTNSSPQASRNRLIPASLLLMTLAGSFIATAPARADVHVGVSLGLELPHGYSEVRVGRDRYYTHHGVYYQRGPRGYVVVRAPRGAFIRTLPPHYTRIYIGSSVYYRYGDVYYQPSRDGYVVVDAPTTTQPLPPAPPVEDYQSVWAGKQEYLFKDGQFFSKTPDGMVWVSAPIGAVTRDLPSDARSVWFQNEEYFESDEVYFHKTPAGYEVVTAPWKK